MAGGKRISEFDNAAALTGAELLPCIQSGGNKKFTTSLLARIAQFGANWWTTLTATLAAGWSAIFASAPGTGWATALAGTYAALLDRVEPIGSAKLYFGYVSPDASHAFATGQAVSRTTYAALFAILTADMGACTISIASPGVVTRAAHARSTGDCIELTTTGALPTGLLANTNYYIIRVDADTFRLAASLADALAGTAINTTGTQSGTHSIRYAPWGISGASNFLLPDARESTFYGIGQRASGITGAHDLALLGQFMENRLEDHFHSTDYFSSGGSGSNTQSFTTNQSGTAPPTKGAITDGVNAVRKGATTRGNQLGVNILMRLL
jgi:hypothetical protein